MELTERRDSKSKDHVEEPIGGGRERDSLGPNLAGEDLSGVSPRGRTPGCGEGSDEKVRARNDGLGNGRLAVDNPADVLVRVVLGLGSIRLSVGLLKGT